MKPNPAAVVSNKGACAPEGGREGRWPDRPGARSRGLGQGHAWKISSSHCRRKSGSPGPQGHREGGGGEVTGWRGRGVAGWGRGAGSARLGGEGLDISSKKKRDRRTVHREPWVTPTWTTTAAQAHAWDSAPSPGGKRWAIGLNKRRDPVPWNFGRVFVRGNILGIESCVHTRVSGIKRERRQGAGGPPPPELKRKMKPSPPPNTSKHCALARELGL